jgi:hypothetical protein
MNPERSIVGSINPINEINIAVCMVFEIVEIKIPSDRLIRIYSMHSSRSRTMLPFTGKIGRAHV